MARLLSAVLAGGLLLVTACGAEPSLDPESLVEGLPGAVLPEAPQLVREVSCPDPEPEVIAQSMTCGATLNGDAVTIDLDIDEDARVTASLRTELLDLDEVAAEAATRLSDDLGVEVEVTCPAPVVVDRIGRQVECVGDPGGSDVRLVVEIVDDDGTWTLTIR